MLTYELTSGLISLEVMAGFKTPPADIILTAGEIEMRRLMSSFCIMDKESLEAGLVLR